MEILALAETLLSADMTSGGIGSHGSFAGSILIVVSVSTMAG
jgi:hypothetical protein